VKNFDTYRVVQSRDGFDEQTLGAMNAVWGNEYFLPGLVAMESEDALAKWVTDPNVTADSFDLDGTPIRTAISGLAFAFDLENGAYCFTDNVRSEYGVSMVSVGLQEWGSIEADSAKTSVTLTPTHSRAALGTPEDKPAEWKDYPLTARTYAVSTGGLNAVATVGSKIAFSGVTLTGPNHPMALDLFSPDAKETVTYILRRAN
jgi:hypothetical protein